MKIILNIILIGCIIVSIYSIGVFLKKIDTNKVHFDKSEIAAIVDSIVKEKCLTTGWDVIHLGMMESTLWKICEIEMGHASRYELKPYIRWFAARNALRKPVPTDSLDKWKRGSYE